MSGVAVPAATVGTVCTHPDHRGRGIGLELMRFADEVMKRDDIVLARLHTSAVRFGFYGRCGYVKAITHHPSMRLDPAAIRSKIVQQAETELGDAVVRPAQPRDATRMNAIYEATFSHGTGAVSRSEHFFLRRIGHWPKLWMWYAPRFAVVDDPADGVVGYIAYSLDTDNSYGTVVELATLPHHARVARTLLLHAVREAQQCDVRKLDVFIDVHEPLGWLVGEFPMHGESDVSVMFLKVQDEKTFVDLMLPIIRQRAERFEIKLTMTLAGRGDVTIGDGQELRIVTDVQHLAALLYNGAWLAGLLGQGALDSDPDTAAAHRALRKVFGDTHASRCKLDGF